MNPRLAYLHAPSPRAAGVESAELRALRARLARAEAERDEALETLAQAQRLARMDQQSQLLHFNLSRVQNLIFCALIERVRISVDDLFARVYQGRGPATGKKSLHVNILHTRRRLKPHGIFIRSGRDLGYWLDPEVRARLKRGWETA